MITEIPPGGRVPPAAALVAEIDKRRSTAAVQFSGLAPVLDMLRAYIVGTEARISQLENDPARNGAVR